MKTYIVIYLAEGALHIDEMDRDTLAQKVIKHDLYQIHKFDAEGATLKNDPSFPITTASYIADCAKLQLIDHREES